MSAKTGNNDNQNKWSWSLKWANLFLFVKFCSAGLEILEEILEPDVVIVCCGGGGLLSGVAAAIKLQGNKTTRIFGVEPEGGRYLILSYFLFVDDDSQFYYF